METANMEQPIEYASHRGSAERLRSAAEARLAELPQLELEAMRKLVSDRCSPLECRKLHDQLAALKTERAAITAQLETRGQQ